MWVCGRTDPLWDGLCLPWADTGPWNSQHTAPLSEHGWTLSWSCSSLKNGQRKGGYGTDVRLLIRCRATSGRGHRWREPTWTLHIHKVRVGTLNETLLLVPPLLLLRGWVQQVFCELDLKKKRKRKNHISHTGNLKYRTSDRTRHSAHSTQW